MHFAELIEARYSVRAYRPDPVDPAQLAQVLEAARLAPTAANRQPVRLHVVTVATHREQLQAVYGRAWFVQAPLVLAVSGVRSEAWTRRDGRCYVDVDAAIVMDHLILRAAELGLGTCWIAAFDLPAARALLGSSDDVEPLLFTPLGHPADALRSKPRRPLAELVTFIN